MKRNDIVVLSSYVIDDVIVEVDTDGNEHFRPVEKHQKHKEKIDNRSWFGKIIDWWKNATVRPYVKIRDLSDPLDKLEINDGSNRHGAEIGIEVKF